MSEVRPDPAAVGAADDASGRLPDAAPAAAVDVSAVAGAPVAVSPGSGQTATATGARADAGFGYALATAREAQGIPAAEMAGRLRLHLRQLQALEQERLEELPSAPFVRGYVRSYAKELKIDPAPLLAALGSRLPAPATLGLTAPAGAVMTEVRRAGIERASRVMVIGGTVVALLIFAVAGWIASTRLQPAAVPTSAPQATAPQAAAPTAEPGPAVAAPGAGESPAASTVPSGATAPAASAPPALSADAAPATSVAPAAPAQATAAAASPMTNGLRLQVSGKPSWIEVTDADGRVVFVGTLSGGAEQYLANLRPPVRLTIGNASTVTVTFRGKLVDLQPHIRANDLARLTLE